MLIVYILILVLLSANLYHFFKIIRPNNNDANKNIYYLHTFIEPIIRCFNAFKFKEYNEKYKINI